MPDPIEYLIQYYTGSNLLSSNVYLLWDNTPVIGCDLRLTKAALNGQYPFIHRDTGEDATSLALGQSLRDMQNFKINHSEPDSLITPQMFSPVSDFIIPRKQLMPIQIQSLLVLDQSLEVVYEGYKYFPPLIKAAIIDLNLHFGIGKCFAWNEALVDAIEAKNWEECAQISQRGSVCDSRNRFIYNNFLGRESSPSTLRVSSENRSRKSPDVKVANTKPQKSKRVSSKPVSKTSHKTSNAPVSQAGSNASNSGTATLSHSTQGAAAQSWQDVLIKELEHSEGTVDHLYCDTVGYVTIGVGCMLPNEKAACELPLRHRETDQLASEQEKADAFHAIKDAFTDNARAAYYTAISNLYLPHDDIAKELKKKIDGFITRVKKNFPAFDSFPDNAKIGILDMAYNLGVQGIVKKFPTFSRGIREQDWNLCAEQCRRKQVSQERNDWVKNLFLQTGG